MLSDADGQSTQVAFHPGSDAKRRKEDLTQHRVRGTIAGHRGGRLWRSSSTAIAPSQPGGDGHDLRPRGRRTQMFGTMLLR